MYATRLKRGSMRMLEPVGPGFNWLLIFLKMPAARICEETERGAGIVRADNVEDRQHDEAVAQHHRPLDPQFAELVDHDHEQ